MFQRAYALSPTPRVTAQLGFAEQAVGAWSDASVHLHAAAAAQTDPWINNHRVLITQALDFVATQMPTEPPPPPVTSPSVTPRPASAHAEVVAPAPLLASVPRSEEHADPPPFRTYGVIAGGAALLSAGLGVLGLVLRNSAATSWNSPACLQGNMTRGQNCNNDYQTGQTWQTVETAGFIAGGALAVASIVLFALPVRRESPIALVPGPGDVGVGCRVAF